MPLFLSRLAGAQWQHGDVGDGDGGGSDDGRKTAGELRETDPAETGSEGTIQANRERREERARNEMVPVVREKDHDHGQLRTLGNIIGGAVTYRHLNLSRTPR